LEEDEPIVWGKEGGEYSIFVALVSKSLFSNFENIAEII